MDACSISSSISIFHKFMIPSSILLQLTYSHNTQAELELKYMAHRNEYSYSKKTLPHSLTFILKSKPIYKLTNDENMYHISNIIWPLSLL